ncbi:MAG: hypothetical protein KGL39_04635 [Patescibacteria group bacterium]|nr:hypothetical protein [Patescibacteria group bacterium]
MLVKYGLFDVSLASLRKINATLFPHFDIETFARREDRKHNGKRRKERPVIPNQFNRRDVRAMLAMHGFIV